MDENGDPINYETHICDLMVSPHTLHSAILLDWIDDATLNTGLTSMNISNLAPQGVNKSLKLMQVLGSEKVKIVDIINCCKPIFKSAFQKMFFTFIVSQSSIKSSTPVKTDPAVDKSLELLTSTLSMQVNALSHLPGELAAAVTNTTRYADQPNGPSPEFDMSKANQSFAHFCENKYSRWMYEEKLNVNDDYYRHLHKVFPKRDQNDAYKIIKTGLAESPRLANEQILARLVQHFKFQAADGEEFDLKEKFLTSTINPNHADQSFIALYNQLASILSITKPGIFNDKERDSIERDSIVPCHS